MTKPRLSAEQLAEHKERANRKRQVRRLWKGSLTDDEIASEVGISLDELRVFAMLLGLPARTPSFDYLPTPEEIRLAAARIRANWTTAELESRRMPWRGMLE
jgi:hypothetical protein